MIFSPYLFSCRIKSVAMSAQSIRKAKRPRVVTTLETKLKMIRNVEADLCCYKEVLTEMKKARIQPRFFLKEDI
jgi:hypothetical protein